MSLRKAVVRGVQVVCVGLTLGLTVSSNEPACAAILSDDAVLEQQSATQYVRSNSNLRERPTAESEVLVVVPRGSSVTVRGCESQWCSVTYREHQGYLSQSLLSVSSPSPAPPARRNCCRVCTTGKPCGNSCINRNYTCRQPPGCAC